MDCVAIGLDWGSNHATVLISQSLWGLDWCGPPWHRLLIDSSSIIYTESNVFDTISVLCMVGRELSMVGVEWGCESIHNLVVADNVGAKFAWSCFQALQRWDKNLANLIEFRSFNKKIWDWTYLVSNVFEAHLAGVKCSCLLGISNPEANVVETVEDTDFRLKKKFWSRSDVTYSLSWFCVIYHLYCWVWFKLWLNLLSQGYVSCL